MPETTPDTPPEDPPECCGATDEYPDCDGCPNRPLQPRPLHHSD